MPTASAPAASHEPGHPAGADRGRTSGSDPGRTAGTASKARWVALIGNPNTGKTTVFNALTGYRAKVANYPGVTVDKKSGPMKGVAGVFVLDLPGTYSLAARSPDEMVAVDVLLGRRADTPRPDAAVIVADASNLERNLYLATQALETGVPAVLALNLMDIAKARSHEIDVPALSACLGIPVVPLVASRGEGIPELVTAVKDLLASGTPPKPIVLFPDAFEREVAALNGALEATPAGRVPAFERRRMLLDVGGHAERRMVERGGPVVQAALVAARERLAAAGHPVAGLEAALRYGHLAGVSKAVLRQPPEPKDTATDRIDRVLTHRVLGAVVFAAVMTLVFLSIFSFASPIMDFLDSVVFGRLAAAVTASGILGGGALESLVVKGVIGGVGGVLVFLPQILILFGFLALLEDCGYMARAAFLMDRLLRWCGLSGKSFIPMLSSFACAVPGIMATRTIESRRDRLATILVAPLMSCSARIPVYAVMIGLFVPGDRPWTRALVFAAMYFLGIAVSVPVAFLLKRTILKGEAPPFLMELPPYKVPAPRAVLQRMVQQGSAFVVRAGTLILAASVVVWALSYFPHDASVAAARDQAVARADAALAADLAAAKAPDGREEAKARADEAKDEAERVAAGTWLRESLMGRAGRAIEPLVEPIGWDWKVGVAVIASFPAREVVVSTMGVLYDLGDTDDQSALRDRLKASRWEDGPKKGQPVFDLGSSLALMVFFALCLQCASTLAVMYRETGSWRWPALAFAYMTSLAYVGALLTATVARALS